MCAKPLGRDHREGAEGVAQRLDGRLQAVTSMNRGDYMGRVGALMPAPLEPFTLAADTEQLVEQEVLSVARKHQKCGRPFGLDSLSDAALLCHDLRVLRAE